MTKEDKQRIESAIQRHADCWWNDVEDDDPPNRTWIVDDILKALEADGLDLQVVELAQPGDLSIVEPSHGVCDCDWCRTKRRAQEDS